MSGCNCTILSNLTADCEVPKRLVYAIRKIETAVSLELNQRVKFDGIFTVNEVGKVELNETTPVKGIQLFVVTSKK
jgi:hypothetical protein